MYFQFDPILREQLFEVFTSGLNNYSKKPIRNLIDFLLMSSKKAEEYSGLLEAPLVRQADSELKNWGTEISHIFEDETKFKNTFQD